MKRRVFLSLFFTAFLLTAGMPTVGFAQETLEASEPSPYKDVPEDYLQEADDFFKYCDHTPKMKQYYNCECLAVAFLDRRIAVGPEPDQNSILFSIRKQCADATEAAGRNYDTCLSQAPLLPDDVKPEEYCECYANTYAKLYEKSPGTGTKAFIRLRTKAAVTCSNPALARKLYPGG